MAETIGDHLVTCQAPSADSVGSMRRVRLRALVQRVSQAAVDVEGDRVAQIGPGMLVLLGVRVGDTAEDADRLAEKVRALRIFDDAEGRMNEPLGEREVLCVSQFTLYGDARRGNRPSYTDAAPAEVAEPLYDRFCERLDAKKGVFGACMGVALVNDGPVTADAGEHDRSAPAYDRMGIDYAEVRRPDPRIEAVIDAALGDARTVLNVGAGAGSYEPTDREVIAVEPSPVMIAQRPAGAAPAIEAVVEELPLADDSVDAVMGVFTMQHWSDVDRGLAEVARVARDRVGVRHPRHGRGRVDVARRRVPAGADRDRPARLPLARAARRRPARPRGRADPGAERLRRRVLRRALEPAGGPPRPAGAAGLVDLAPAAGRGRSSARCASSRPTSRAASGTAATATCASCDELDVGLRLVRAEL